MKTYTFHMNGMHCKSCVALAESELSEIPGVSSVRASLAETSVTVTGEFGDQDPEHIAQDLSVVLAPHGYTLLVTKRVSVVAWDDFRIAIPLAIALIALLVVLQKLGIVNVITTSEVSYGTAFLVGLVASVSTCMAVVGGLVLSVSANFAKSGDPVRPQVLFHAGRLASFFLLGGTIGVAGSVFELGTTGTLVINIVVALTLVVLGLNLLDIFPWMKRMQPTLPSFLGTRVHSLKKMNHTLTPLLLGIATFFLPCGFTQSMQIYALSTGSFLTGALTMFVFALGTLPVLALLSFSSLSITGARSGVFFKTAGLVVICFGVFNIISALTGAGIIPPIFSL